MKTILLSFLIMFSGLAGIAADRSASSLFVYSAGGENFSLYLNGVLQNQIPMANMRIINLNPSDYFIELTFGQNYYGISNQLSLNPGTERTYVIEKKYASVQDRAAGRRYGSTQGQYALRLVSEVVSQDNIILYNPDVMYGSKILAPMSQQNFTVIKNKIAAQKLDAGKMSIAKRAVVSNCMLARQVAIITQLFSIESSRLEFAKHAYTYTYDQENYELVNNAFSLNSSVTQLDVYISSLSAGNNFQPNPRGNGNSGGYRNNFNTRNNSSNNIPVVLTMTEANYSAAKNTISEKSFESSKLTLAKQIVASNTLTSEQVSGIVKLFGFESSRLEFAKYAYDHTYDKGNYFKVNDAFEFESSVSSLSQYITTK